MTREAVREQILDLQIDHATSGLGETERSRLDTLLAQEGETHDTSFELAASAVELVCLGPLEEMPASLKARLRRQGDAFVPRQEHTGPLPDNVTPMRRGSAVETPAQQSAPQPAPERTSGGSNWIPWLLAAAGIGAAVFGWRPIQEPPVQLEGPPVVASVEQRRAVFVDAASDLLSLPWTATEDPAASGAGGDVVWSPERQQGFMRFTGLEVNDPGEFQYQLWIFDGTRDDRYPIDGGVFDVTTSGEVVVPIDAKLNVRQPALFAVTIEAPGGVVVSGRDRIVTLAQVG